MKLYKTFRKINNSNIYNELNRFSFCFNKNREVSFDSIDEQGYLNLNFSNVYLLSNRKLISVFGKDSTNLLQDLTTNDINKLNCDNTLNNIIYDPLTATYSFTNKRISQSSLFLDNKGKIMFDTIISKSHFSPNTYPEYWIEIDTCDEKSFLDHLSLHKLRKEVYFDSLSDKLSIFCYINNNYNPKTLKGEKEGHVWEIMQSNIEYEESHEDPTILTTDSISFIDPRSHCLGTRFYSNINNFKDDIDVSKSLENNTEHNNKYKIIRYLYGIPEGNEVSNMFPLNCNYQFLEAISFNKGCYLGQEYTQRTFFSGVIRKKLMPFIITNDLKYLQISQDSFSYIPLLSIDCNYNKDLKNLEILDSSEKKIGKVLVYSNNAGIAIINTSLIKENDVFNLNGDNCVLMDFSNVWRNDEYLPRH